MRTLSTLALALALAACGSAAGSIAPGELGITARDAYLEARTEARSWDAGARLRYVEGIGIAASGEALPGQGEWRFHYTAPGKAQELLVQVTPLRQAAEERPVTSPPGFVLGDNALDGGWVDSPAVLETVRASAQGAGGAATLLLVPTRPAQWVVELAEGGTGRWYVDAASGALVRR